MKLKRLLSIDILKGIFMILVILAHRIFYDWPEYQNPLEGSVNPLLLIFGFFAAMGSIFTFISGIVTSFSIHRRIEGKKNTPKQLILGALVMFLWLGIMNYLSIFLFAGGIFLNEEFRFGVITGYLLQGSSYTPGLEIIVLYAGILMVTGLSGIVITITYVILYKKHGLEQIGKIKRGLLIVGCVILVLAGFAHLLLEPLMLTAFDNGNYFLSFLLANLVAFDFPIIPVLGFGVLGAVIGVSLASREEYKDFRKFWMIFAAIVTGIGIVLVLSFFLAQGVLVLQFARFLHLGIIIFAILPIIKGLDFKTEENKERIYSKPFTKLIRRYGSVSLTIFVFETPLAMLFKLLLNLIIPGWNTPFWSIMIFGIFNLCLWAGLLTLWERINYKGSLEWLGAQLIKWLSGKKSNKIVLKKE